MSKRTLEGFFAPANKKLRSGPEAVTVSLRRSASPRSDKRAVPSHAATAESTGTPTSPSTKTTNHITYPWPVLHLPPDIESSISGLVTAQGQVMNDQPHLDLLYFQPFIPRSIAHSLFHFLRSELFFYRVQYTIKRFGKDTQIKTPRYTTVFGLDETSRFSELEAAETSIVEASTGRPVSSSKYRCTPRPVPACLDHLRRVTEAATNTSYNFCLVNYYATGADSIAFHSDDEYFLGPNPAIASFTLGAQRDFVMKHKPPNDPTAAPVGTTPVKLALAGGDMLLMHGPTQAHWLHSIPKRKGGEADRGRINITLRKAMIPAGTENYYRYNVGEGNVYKWDQTRKEMVPWSKKAG